MTWHPDMPLAYRDSIVTGDAKELARAIPDESVDLVFTDPVYQDMEAYRWLAETAVRVLKPDSATLVFCGIGYLPQTLDALRAGGLSYRWQFSAFKPSGFQSSRFCQRGFSNWQSCLWMEKGKSLPANTISDLVGANDSGRNNFHPSWAKNPQPWRHWLCGFTEDGAVVLDPFVGGGTCAALCRRFNRRFVAFEQDAEQAQKARARIVGIEPLLILPQFTGMRLALPLEVAL
jgi:hypothetical protein